jgi:type II secretory pathway component PulC
MRHPFWILNSSLLGILIFILIFIFFSRQPLPSRVPFEPNSDIKLPKKELSKIDINKIFTNDLFNTYKAPIQEIKIEKIKVAPTPPPPKPVQPSAPLPAKFLDPLGVELKGIMVSYDEDLNRAIIKDKKSGTTKNYKSGDMIEDAQLIRILNKKIILIRSNGQQETIYISKKDAEVEKLLSSQSNWQETVQKIDDITFGVDPHVFVARVRNLAQFIDMLNLTTVYRQGKGVGTRVGKLSENSLGLALGLQQGDIIEFVDGIEATDTAKRYQIYQNIINLSLGDSVTITLHRGQKPITLTYTLKELERTVETKKSPEQEIHKALIGQKTDEEIKQEQIKILEEKERLAPTLYELEKREKKDMLERASRNPAPKESRRGILATTVSEREQPLGKR